MVTKFSEVLDLSNYISANIAILKSWMLIYGFTTVNQDHCFSIKGTESKSHNSRMKQTNETLDRAYQGPQMSLISFLYHLFQTPHTFLKDLFILLQSWYLPHIQKDAFQKFWYFELKRLDLPGADSWTQIFALIYHSWIFVLGIYLTNIRHICLDIFLDLPRHLSPRCLHYFAKKIHL